MAKEIGEWGEDVCRRRDQLTDVAIKKKLRIERSVAESIAQIPGKERSNRGREKAMEVQIAA